jgi:hypothetical protein
MNTNEKRIALAKYETKWVLNGATEADIYDILLNGWIGWSNVSDDAVDETYVQSMANPEGGI